MTTAAVTYADVEGTIDCPIDLVWATVAAFGDIDRWAAGVTGCTIEGQGVGAVRTVSLGDRSVRERLETLDCAAHLLRYRILEPHAMPARNVVSTIELASLSETRTAIRWRSEATDMTVPVEQLSARIGAFYATSIEGLKQLLEA